MVLEPYRVVSIAMLALPVLVCFLLWHALDRRIDTVHVDSELSREEREAVIAAVRGAIDGGILSVDIDRVAGALRDLSWPRAVSVRRVWPDRLDVNVSKVTLIARWREDQYLTSTGSVVKVPEPVWKLPLLDCAMATPLEAMEMFGLLREIAAGESLLLTELRQNRIGEWQIRFADQLTVNLGAEKVVERMRRFAWAYRNASRINPVPIAYVDTRYPNGVAIRFNELLADGGVVKN